LLYFYVVENALKIIGYGIIPFCKDVWNVFDFCTLILYALYFAIPGYISIDVSPVRLMKLLIFLGIFIKPL